MKTHSQKIAVAAMFAALACVATMIIKIPTPLKGYVNLGDCIVLLCGSILSPAYAFLAAGIGSALADVLSGYMVYAPITFLIKGVMALLTVFLFKAIDKKGLKQPTKILPLVLAEIIMVGGYFIFEGILYGFAPSAANIPANAIQGVAGIVFGFVLIKAFEKIKLFK